MIFLTTRSQNSWSQGHVVSKQLITRTCGLKTADHKAKWSQKTQNNWSQGHVVSKQLITRPCGLKTANHKATWFQNSWSQGHVVFMAVVTDDLLTCETPGYLRNPETQKKYYWDLQRA